MLEGLRLALGVPVAVLLAPAKMVGAGEMVWDTVKGAAALLGEPDGEAVGEPLAVGVAEPVEL